MCIGIMQNVYKIIYPQNVEKDNFYNQKKNKSKKLSNFMTKWLYKGNLLELVLAFYWKIRFSIEMPPQKYQCSDVPIERIMFTVVALGLVTC